MQQIKRLLKEALKQLLVILVPSHLVLNHLWNQFSHGFLGSSSNGCLCLMGQIMNLA
jgi:hypothetical protein